MQIQFLWTQKPASVALLQTDHTCSTGSKPFASLSASFLLPYPTIFFLCSLSFTHLRFRFCCFLSTLNSLFFVLLHPTSVSCFMISWWCSFPNSCQCYFQFKSYYVSFFCNFLHASFWVHLTLSSIYSPPFFLLLFHYFLLFSSPLLLLFLSLHRPPSRLISSRGHVHCGLWRWPPGPGCRGAPWVPGWPSLLQGHVRQRNIRSGQHPPTALL